MVNASTAVAVAGAGTGRIADALVRAESNLAAVREHGIGPYFEPLLLATMARCRLAGGESDGALAGAEEAVDVMHARGLTTCALSAPLALAQVLVATQGAAAGERIEAVLVRAEEVAHASGARAFALQIERARAPPARPRAAEQVH